MSLIHVHPSVSVTTPVCSSACPPNVLTMKLGAIIGAIVTDTPHCATTRVRP